MQSDKITDFLFSYIDIIWKLQYSSTPLLLCRVPGVNGYVW